MHFYRSLLSNLPLTENFNPTKFTLTLTLLCVTKIEWNSQQWYAQSGVMMSLPRGGTCSSSRRWARYPTLLVFSIMYSNMCPAIVCILLAQLYQHYPGPIKLPQDHRVLPVMQGQLVMQSLSKVMVRGSLHCVRKVGR